MVKRFENSVKYDNILTRKNEDILSRLFFIFLIIEIKYFCIICGIILRRKFSYE